MKVVINACHGGFSLSSEALVYLANKNSDFLEKMTFFKYYGKGKKDLSEWNELKFVKGSKKYKSSCWGNSISDGKYVYTITIEDRTHPDLIKVIEKLGEKANGSCSKLKIVEIPDDVNWEIEEYDGWERVREVSRVWD